MTHAIEDVPGLIEYKNVPPTIGAVISGRKATLHECQTVYSVEDLYNMLEVITIDAHNKFNADEYFRSKNDR